MIKISVVIPCYNEEKFVGGLLKDLSHQTIAPNEVIVADCGSTDKTAEVAKSFASKLPIKIAKSKYQSPGATRNVGAKKAQSEYLLFIDADIRIPKDLIEKITTSLDNTPVDFLTPRYKSDGQHIVDSGLMWHINNLMLINFRLLKRLWAIGGVMVVKRTMHDKIGGFSQKLKVGDDIDYSRKLRKHGASFIYLNNVQVFHSSRRFQGYGVPKAILALLTENSKAGKWVFQPALQKFGRGRKYGHF